MAETEVHRHLPRWRTTFEVGSTLVLVILAAAIVWEGRARFFGAPPPRPSSVNAPIPTEPIAIGESPVRGVLSAPVAIIEYADFECNSCAQFAMMVEPGLLQEYVDKGRVLVVFKHFPLKSHPGARNAARAAWCAFEQGKFWEMRDRLFRIRGGLEDSYIQAAAQTTGLDMAIFNFCRATDESDQQVQRDKTEGERLKIPGTPTFFVGRVVPDRRVQVTDAVVGATEALQEALRRLLAK